MSFNKRFINLENLLYKYQMNNDIEEVKNYITKPDALIVNTMDSSHYIVDKIIQGDYYGAILIIEYEQSRQGIS
jgi:hypothetical protein